MSEYSPFSQIYSGSDPRFNDIWDENTSVQEEETKEESQPGSIPFKSSSSEPIPIIKKVTKEKPKRKGLSISTITADDQSVISSISKSTFRSYTSSSLDMGSFLFDASMHIDRERSGISTMGIEKPKSSKNSMDGMCGSTENSMDGICILNLFDSFVGDRTLNVTSCVSEETVITATSHIPQLCTEASDKSDEISKPSKLDEAQTDSSQAKYIGCQALPPAPCEVQVNTDCANQNDDALQPADKTVAHNVFFNISEPIGSIPELLTSTAVQFMSLSINVNDEVSDGSIVNKSEDKRIVSMETQTEVSTVTSDVPTVATLEETRLDERSLLDSLLPEVPMESQTAEASEASEDPTQDIAVEPIEEENVTEGLGLNLPPQLASPQLASPQLASPQLAPKSLETEDLLDTSQATIEVDETGKIVMDEVDSSSDCSISNESHHSEVDTSHRDVYISYRFEGDQSDDNTSMSSSQASESNNTPLLTPKQNSGLKSFLKPRWGRKMKLFSSSGNKDKSTPKNKSNGITKPANSIYDSPGSATVGTADTAMTMHTYATLSFAEDIPVNPRKIPFMLRRRSRVY